MTFLRIWFDFGGMQFLSSFFSLVRRLLGSAGVYSSGMLGGTPFLKYFLRSYEADSRLLGFFSSISLIKLLSSLE